MHTQETTSSPVQILAANPSFLNKLHPYAAYWPAQKWQGLMEFTGYEGLEYHAMRLGARATKLAATGLIGSVHQSWRRPESNGLLDRLFPEGGESLGQLARLGTYALVAYPEFTPSAVEVAVANNRFASVSAQVYPGLMRHAGVRSPGELTRWMQDRGLKVCWPSFHCRREDEGLSMGDFRDSIPALAESGMLEELHVEIGRGDAHKLAGVNQELMAATHYEIRAFMQGADEAAKTATGQMIQLAVRHRPPGSGPLRIAVETSQDTLIGTLDKGVLPPMRTQVPVAHAGIVRSIRALADAASAA